MNILAQTIINIIHYRRELVNMRRQMANELLFGRAACYMFNKFVVVAPKKKKCRSIKKLQKLTINHLYQLKLNKFKLPYMELEDQMKSEGKQSSIDINDTPTQSTTKKKSWKGKSQKPALKKEKKG